MNPFFSIIIPVYNSEKTIKQTLDSVLYQTINDYEIIIVDDCSTDGTFDIINKYKDESKNITIIVNDHNLGVAESRNLGFQITKGEYIALLDGDDIWMPDKLEKQKSVIKSTNCDICCTSYNFIDVNSKIIKRTYRVPELINYNMLLKENHIGCSTVVIKRSLLLNHYMDNSYNHEDYALWLELTRKGATVIGINEPLMNYRIISSSRSFNKIISSKNRMIIYVKQEKFGILKSSYYLLHYAFNGIMKKLL